MHWTHVRHTLDTHETRERQLHLNHFQTSCKPIIIDTKRRNPLISKCPWRDDRSIIVTMNTTLTEYTTKGLVNKLKIILL
jgi:hypothetical protein